MVTAGTLPVAARYDGHADWYDSWARSAGSSFITDAQRTLAEFLPEDPGLAIDLGCGTGLHAHVVRDHGFPVFGVDYSADQLRHARARLPVLRADARAVPLASGCARLVFSILTHTDLDGFDRLVSEAVRLLAPGGVFIYVGVHPCFINPFAEYLPDGVRLHPGYRDSGWQAPTPFTGNAVRHRVGVHHLTLERLLTSFLTPYARLDRIAERRGSAVPEILAVRLTRLPYTM
jgi:SAM-dependent methyltransferase